MTYLQSASKLFRDIYLKPGKHFEVEENNLLKLIRHLVGLSDSGDYWNTEFSDHIRDDLQMKSKVADYGFFFRKFRGKLMGLMRTYVGDRIATGSTEFEKGTNMTAKKI